MYGGVLELVKRRGKAAAGPLRLPAPWLGAGWLHLTAACFVVCFLLVSLLLASCSSMCVSRVPGVVSV